MSFVIKVEAPAIELLLREILQSLNQQDRVLANINGRLGTLATNGVNILATLADLKAKVDAQGTVIDSAVTLINGISQQLKDALANNDPNAVQAVIDELDAQDQALAAAVANNTPAPAPTPEPPVDTTGGAASA